MQLKSNKFFAAGFVLASSIPHVTRAGRQNWFTSTGMTEEREEPSEVIGQGQQNTLITAVNPRMFDLTISLHNSPAGDDDGSTQDTDPGSADQDKIEKIIQYMADGVYEATEGAHKIREVRIFRDKKKHDVADIRWDVSGHPCAHLNGISDSGLHIFMYDDFNGYDLLTNLIGAGHTLTHELGHYAYGLGDEYKYSSYEGDDPVEPSIMNNQWLASDWASQTLVDARWLQFSIKNQNATHPGLYQNTLKTHQHRLYAESCWETLSRDNTVVDILSAFLSGQALRTVYPELALVAPKGTDTPSSPDLPGSARSALDIIWMANSTVSEIVIDKSGSMGDENKMSNARTAAKLLVDLSKIGDYIGVIAFASSPYAVVPLTEIVDQATKNSIKAAIDTIVDDGGTLIGAAAQAALNALTASGTPEGNKVVYLLTDGEQSEDNALAPIPAYEAAKIPIFAFAYGSGADTSTLGQMASFTKGKLYISPVLLAEITQAFQDANAAASGSASIAAGSSSAPVGSTDIVPFTVDSTLDTVEVTVTFTGSASDLSVVLIDPSTTGTPLSPSETTESGGETLVLFTINNPSSGEWLIKATENTGVEIPFVWGISGNEEGAGFVLTGDTSDGKMVIEYPDPFILRSSLTHDLPIINAVVEATVTAPDGTSITTPMTDDGTPPDNMAGDGEYTAVVNYDQSGIYQVSVRARGVSGVVMQDAQGLMPAVGPDGNFVPYDPASPIDEDFERFVRFQIETTNVVLDDHGNTHDTATTLSASNDESIAGKVEAAGDVDVFKILPQNLTELVVRVSNLAFDMKPVLKIINELNVAVAEGTLDTSSSQAGLLSLKFPAFANETYFAEVSHQDVNGTGYYQISAGGMVEQYDSAATVSSPTGGHTVSNKSPKNKKNGKSSKSSDKSSESSDKSGKGSSKSGKGSGKSAK